MSLGVVVALLGLACVCGWVFAVLLVADCPAEDDDGCSEQGRIERCRKAGWR